MRFIVAGGEGGGAVVDGQGAGNGGGGAQLSGTVSVTPGQAVTVLAGGKGGVGRVSGVSPGGIGYGTGGNAQDSAGGGGAGSSLTLAGNLLVVAGGGGGGGRYTILDENDSQTITFTGDTGDGGGFNGNTAYIARRTTPNQHTVTIQGGRGVTSNAAGAGGTVSGSPDLSRNGNAGSGRNGGNGRAGVGNNPLGSGGGGAGYFGGGSGSTAQKTVGTTRAAAGVQGGGGSNYGASGVDVTYSTNQAAGFVTVVFFG